nr:glycosyltransferase family 2 protein [uncultured Carboxylicivirga sp.]
MKLSVGIITYNEDNKIAATIEAVKNIADEIIIVDSHSSDKTVSISEKLGAKVYTENWKGYGAQKNSVLDKCQGEWILLLDADEVVSNELSVEITKLISHSSYDVYKIKRSAVCFNKKIKHGGFGDDYVIRLWKNGKVHLGEETVHEKYLTNSEVGTIKSTLWHHTYLTLEEYFTKFNKYTTLVANERLKKGKKPSIIKLYINPIFKFIKIYFIKLGFLDGFEGFLLAALASFYTFIKYSKLRLALKNKS